jgi:Flp pilus assembly pilin Flp
MLNFASKAAGLLKRFRKDEDGAMTVEWVAIAAGVVVGAVAITYLVMDNLDEVADGIGTSLTGVPSDMPEPPAFYSGGAGGAGG